MRILKSHLNLYSKRKKSNFKSNKMKIIRKILSKIRGEVNLKKLKKRGLTVGRNFVIWDKCKIDPSHCWHIQIGDNVILATGVHLLAHDGSLGHFLGYGRIGNIKIGNNVFIGERATVLPGVTIGNNVIIGVGSVVTKDIPDNSLAVGVPAKVIMPLDVYLEREKKSMNNENVFDESYSLRNKNLSEIQKKEMIESCDKYGKGYVI